MRRNVQAVVNKSCLLKKFHWSYYSMEEKPRKKAAF